MWTIEVLGLLCEWVIYYYYFSAKKPSTILSFSIHMNACDRWAFLHMITTLLKMSERLCHGLGYFGMLLAMSWPRIFLDTFGNIMA
jgi:hypothetical protein